jgi:hypothetical protein
MASSDTQRQKKFDLRTVDWYIEHGVIGREDYEEFLDGLSDSSEKAEKIEARLPGEGEASGEGQGEEPAGGKAEGDKTRKSTAKSSKSAESRS